MDNTEVKLVPDDSKKVPTIDDMPPELHLKIFGYLTRDDIIAAQCVSHKWRTLAHDKYLWKDYIFVITGTPEDERKLQVMPALRNIEGYVENRFLNVILDHVTNLNKMNCKFKPPMSFAQVQSLVQKYPELQCITLAIRAADTLQSLEILQTCKNLKELSFYRERSFNNSYYFYSPSPELLISIMDIFADCNNFTTLNNLDIHSLTYPDLLKNQSVAEAFTRVLTNKSHQIQSLELTSPVDAGIINAANMCSNIQNLYLYFFEDCPVCIDIHIHRMTQLRSLVLQLGKNNNDFIKKLYNSFSRNSWVNLTNIVLSLETDQKSHANILEALTKNAKQLKALRYWENNSCIYDWQIKHIGNLSNLESLHFFRFNNISSEVIVYVSQCHKLKELLLCAFSTSIANWKLSIANMMISMKQLDSLVFTVGSETVHLICKEQIKMFISKHFNNE